MECLDKFNPEVFVNKIREPQFLAAHKKIKAIMDYYLENISKATNISLSKIVEHYCLFGIDELLESHSIKVVIDNDQSDDKKSYYIMVEGTQFGEKLII